MLEDIVTQEDQQLLREQLIGGVKELVAVSHFITKKGYAW